MPARTVLKDSKKSHAHLMVRVDDGRRKPRTSRGRTIVTTRYGRWILARRKLVNHLASGKAMHNLE